VTLTCLPAIQGENVITPTNRENEEARIDILRFSEMMKPELTGLSVLTTICAYYLGSRNSIDVLHLFYTALGTLLVGGAAGTLNQYIERNYDRLMRRTERRPLPSGRMTPTVALVFGLSLAFVGLFTLLIKVNGFATGIALLTLLSYLLVYTPLKRRTTLNTIVGTIPGALPALIGWTAVRNDVSSPAIILFAMLVFWQMPHFLSLGWMYRKDYARAGFKMLPVIDEKGRRIGFSLLAYSILLLLTSISFTFLGTTGNWYLVGSFLMGLIFIVPILKFVEAARNENEMATMRKNKFSRIIFFSSLVYLPGLMVLMSVDKIG
jgi:protoheme IX farnesyltransferase